MHTSNAPYMRSLNCENSCSRPGCFGPPRMPTNITALTITPVILPMPPKITITRVMMDVRIRKLDGKTAPTFAVRIAPLKEPMIAPTMKASSLA